jgi:phage terminase large subunit-like protein
MNVVDAYAQSVITGAVPAGKYHKLACARHLRDRAREGAPGFPYVFKIELAERNYRFTEKLKHYKGEWAGEFIQLQPHQKFRRGSKYGWVHQETGCAGSETPTRRSRARTGRAWTRRPRRST